jgi:hypothetical protein
METVEHKMLLARMQALVTCNSALRILVSLYSLRSEIISEKPTEDAITDSEVKITLLVLFGIRHELHICTEILVV